MEPGYLPDRREWANHLKEDIGGEMWYNKKKHDSR